MGSIIDPATPTTISNVQFVEVNRLAYYRLGLPALPADALGTHSGQWNALLRIGRGDNRALDFVATSPQPAIPYDIVVHCYSNLIFKAFVTQDSFEPGANVAVYATLAEYEVPVDHRAIVWADITRPDGSLFSIGLSEAEAGRFEGRFLANLTGLYVIRVRCIGTTFRGTRFQREQTLSASVFPGGDNPPQTGGGSTVAFWCEVVHCLLNEKVLGPKLIEQLRALGIDLAALLRCIAETCRRLKGGATKPCGCSGASPTVYDPNLVRHLAEIIAAEVQKANTN